MAKTNYSVGVDIGGTFTDLIAIDDAGKRTVVKTPTTSADPSIGMLQALEDAAAALALDFTDFLGCVSRICHGTTVTTNAVIEHTGSKVGMLTTQGVRDTIEARRGIRELEYLYDYTYPQPQPLCPRNLRMSIEERVQADGSVHIPLNEEQVRVAVRDLRNHGVDALAVCFLWSFRNAGHEQRAAEICRQEYPDAYLSLSHEIAPLLGEYLRFQTTTVNAYVGPIIEGYMRAMVDKLTAAGYRGALLIVTSSGGLMSPHAIINKAAVTLTSGPASGPVAGVWYGGRYDTNNLITIDMGGTSFDTSLIRAGEISIRAEQAVGGVYHIGLPTVDVHAVGVGGGTIAWLDEAGGVHVGPQSSGAEPGPACYARGGTQATVTDANVVLGRLNPTYFIGGRMQLHAQAATAAVKTLADARGMTVEAMARAIVTIAAAQMVDAVETISVRRGENPRDYALLVGGGAGPGHAAELAQQLGVQRVIVPRESSIFCAVGGIISDLRHDYAASIENPADAVDWQALNATLATMRAEADDILEQEDVAPAERYYRIAADMKYVGQYHEISVDWPMNTEFRYSDADRQAIVQRFHERHETLFAHHDEADHVFVANIKLTAYGKVARAQPTRVATDTLGADAYLKGERPVWFEQTGLAPCPIYDGDRMLGGVEIAGPCVVEQNTTTIVVPPEVNLAVSEYGDFILSVAL